MSCAIGLVALPDRLFWSDEYADAGAALASKRTIGGLLRTWSGTRTGGRPITLKIVRPYAWLTDEQAADLHALAAVPGQIYLLQLDARHFRIRFRDPPFNLTPLILACEAGETLSRGTLWEGEILLEEA